MAAEEPLQLLLDGAPLSVVMRTPGNDLELVVGLLFAERVISGPADVTRVMVSAEASDEVEAYPGLPFPIDSNMVESNFIDVHLEAGAPGRRPQRSFFASSACGVCGQTLAADLAIDFPPLPSGPLLDPTMLPTLPKTLRSGQGVFDRTGGLHAAGLFSPSGTLLLVREDVGRHNAVDKVIGRLLLEGKVPANDSVLAVSGRAGYELVQKAATAGIPALVAVGAPSSLAVLVARKASMTLVGFLRDDRFNVYSGAERLRRSSPS
ncbi:MAG: formate dehydrogenase accessory sulfurtransferase FdhD [Candidatus Dormibacteraceae bacterium]